MIEKRRTSRVEDASWKTCEDFFDRFAGKDWRIHTSIQNGQPGYEVFYYSCSRAWQRPGKPAFIFVGNFVLHCKTILTQVM
jgi:hypothetical protein